MSWFEVFWWHVVGLAKFVAIIINWLRTSIFRRLNLFLHLVRIYVCLCSFQLKHNIMESKKKKKHTRESLYFLAP